VVLSIAVTVALTACGYKRQQIHEDKAAEEKEAIRSVNLSGVYRADKELQATLSTIAAIPELQNMTASLNTEMAILKHRVSFDQNSVPFPLVAKYSQIASGYDGYRETRMPIRKHIDCIVKQDSNSGMNYCDKIHKPQENKIQQQMSAWERVRPIFRIRSQRQVRFRNADLDNRSEATEPTCILRIQADNLSGDCAHRGRSVPSLLSVARAS